jgi:hypothetical protein
MSEQTNRGTVEHASASGIPIPSPSLFKCQGHWTLFGNERTKDPNMKPPKECFPYS